RTRGAREPRNAVTREPLARPAYAPLTPGDPCMATPTTGAPMEKAITLEAPKTLVPRPCQLVIFGGAGDLAWRKLLPAVYNLNAEGVLPSHFAVVAFGLPADGATPNDPDEFIRKRSREGIDRFSRRALDESHWADFARALFFVQGELQRYARLRPAQGQAGSGRSAVRHSRQPGVLPRRAASSGPPVCRASEGRRHDSRSLGPDGLYARHRREADRPRPRQRPRSHPRGRRRVRGEPDVSHRSLPGQGDRAEPLGAPLRQQHLRAALERETHRPRADHRGRGGRTRAVRREVGRDALDARRLLR